MKIKRDEMLAILNEVQPALSTADTVDQAQSFVFEDGEVMTYNDEIAIIRPIPWKFTGAVQGKTLHDFLAKASEEEIEVEMEKGELRFKGKRSKAGIRLDAEIVLPIDEIGEPDDWTDLPDKFLEAVKFCTFSAATSTSMQVLTCIHILGSNVTSCDNFRITSYEMGKGSKKAFPESLLIPATSARHLAKYKPVEYGISNGWVHFRTEEDLVFACRTFSDEYPDLSDLLEVQGDTAQMPDDTQDMLNRAGIFAAEEDELGQLVDITISKNKMKVYGEGDSGWFEEYTKIDHPGEGGTFTVNSKFLADTLSLLKEITIGERSLKLQGEGFVHVVRLIEED